MSSSLRLGLISSYVPKKCGIATFSRDLINGIKANFPNLEVAISAAETDKESYEYDKSVITVTKLSNRQSYSDAAETLNESSVNVVLLQHEYGLFGGKFINVTTNGNIQDYPTGDYILDTINNIKKPIITTFHTVVSKPDPARQKVIKDIINKSAVVITMTKASRKILLNDYKADKKKVFVIPHGVPKLHSLAKAETINNLGLKSDTFYLTMTGFLNVNKGVDLAIKSLPAILKKHPNTHLLVIGQTHPQILAIQGEKYRESLIELAR